MGRIVSIVVLLLLAGFVAADKAVSAKADFIHSPTGKKIASCCSEQKDGNLHCPLAKRAIQSCCCR